MLASHQAPQEPIWKRGKGLFLTSASVGYSAFPHLWLWHQSCVSSL